MGSPTAEKKMDRNIPIGKSERKKERENENVLTHTQHPFIHPLFTYIYLNLFTQPLTNATRDVIWIYSFV